MRRKPTREGGKAFYADVKGRMAEIGRDPEHLKILPAAFVVVGDTIEEAQAKRALLDSLVHYDSGINSLSSMLGISMCRATIPMAPCPKSRIANASKSGRDRTVEAARRDNLTIRQLAAKAGSYSGLAFVGTAASIADEMERWLDERASDGFNIMFPYLPEGLDDFVDKVVPELQRRGIFRKEYEGSTLRDHLGLPRPGNRFFDGQPVAAAAE